MKLAIVRSTGSPKSHRGFSCALPGFSFDQAVERVLEVLDTEGFSIFADIDIKAALAKKLGIDVRPQRIVEAGFPLPGRGWPEAGGPPWTPCNLIIRELNDGCAVVDFTDPLADFPPLTGRNSVPVPWENQKKADRLRAALLGLCSGDQDQRAEPDALAAPFMA